MKNRERLKLLANIVGHIQGDGCISFRRPSRTSKNIYPWMRFNNSCTPLIGILAKEIRALFPYAHIFIKERTYPKGNYFLQVCQSKIVYEFINLGADEHDVPEWIKNSSHSVKESYLKALFDDEGTVYCGIRKCKNRSSYITKSIQMTTTSKKLAFGIRDLLIELKMRPYFTIGKYKINDGEDFAPYFTIGLTNNESILKFNEMINFDHPIKKEKLISMINNPRFRFYQ